MRRAIEISLVALSLAACNSAGKQIEKHRAQGQAKIDAMQALAKKELPPATNEVQKPPKVLRQAGFSEGNTVIVSREALGDVTARGAGVRVEPDSSVQDAARWISGEKPSDYEDAESALRKLRALLAVEYVVVIKATRCTPSKSLSKHMMLKGSCEGEAHLLDLAGKHYGGVTFSAIASDKVESMTFEVGGKDVPIDPQIALDVDLASQMKDAVAKSIRRALPEASL